MQTMVLAAGLGTRLRPYTFVRPKPLFPVLNRPLLNILLDMLRNVGCNRIVINGHHLADQVEKLVTGRGENLIYQYEPDILGTGGSLRQALPMFRDEPILVMNGDVFHNVDLKALYKYHLRSGNRITMAMHDFPRFNMVGVQEGMIRTFRENSRENKRQTLAFTGIHIVDPLIIEMIPKGSFFHIIDLYEKLISQGEKIGCLRVDGSLWDDIGTPEDYLGLHARLLSRKSQQPFPMPLPKGPWLVSPDAKIEEDTVLSGWGCIGNASIGSDVSLRNCVVWDGAAITDGMNLENEIITAAP